MPQNNTTWIDNLSKSQKSTISALYETWFSKSTTKFHTFKFITKTIFKDTNKSISNYTDAIKYLESLDSQSILSSNIKLGNQIVVASDIESTGLEFGKKGRPSFDKSNPQDYRRLKTNSERFNISETELEEVYEASTGKIDRMTEFASVFYIKNVDGEVLPAQSNDSQHITFHRFINPDLKNKVPESKRIQIDIDDIEAQQVTGHTKAFLLGKEPHGIWGNTIEPAIPLEDFVSDFDKAMSFAKTDPTAVYSIYHNGDNFDVPFMDEELSREVPGKKLRDSSIVVDSIPLFREQVPTEQLKLFSKLQTDKSYGGRPLLKTNTDVAINPTSRSLDNLIKLAKFISKVDFEQAKQYLNEKELAWLPTKSITELKNNNSALMPAINRLNSTSRDIHGALVDSMLLGDALIVIESILHPTNKKLSMDAVHKRDNQKTDTTHPYQPIIRTEYSLNGAFGKPQDYVERFAELSKDQEDPSMVLADRFTTAGKVKFFKACQEHNIRPLLGMTVDITTRLRTTPKSAVLIAKNKVGEINLNKIGSIAFDSAKSGYEVIDIGSLTPELTEGLSFVATENIDDYLLSDVDNAAAIELTQIRKLFNDDVFIGMSRVADESESAEIEDKLNAKKEALSKKLNIPLYANNKIMFPSEKDYKTQKALDKILNKEQFYAPHNKLNTTAFQYLPTPEQMTSKFSQTPEALQTPVDLFKEARLELELGNPELPDYKVPEGFDSEMSYLKHLVKEGLETRWPTIETQLKKLADTRELQHYVSRITEENDWDFDNNKSVYENIKDGYLKRIDYELEVVEKTGFPGYFLITHNYVNWAKDNQVPIGPGRGSGAGSLVLYALNITDPDPIERGLLFERFLNPERIGMPDVDIDVSQKKRDQVISYFIDTYGEDYVSQIQTYTTLAARASIDATGRALSYKPAEREEVRKIIDETPGVSLSDETQNNESLKLLLNNESKPMVREHIDLATSTEGTISGKGRHAGGIVVFKKPISNYGSSFKPEDDQDSSTIQFDKDDTELLGGVKNDLLGLKNLDIIQMTEEKESLDSKELSDSRYFEDELTLNMLKEAETYGVFQLESPGMQKLLKNIGVTSFDDIVAVLALYRPGPLGSGMDEAYINRKNGIEDVEYPHEKLSELLKPTHGTILYQEQVMGIARILANYSLGEADLLRKAMGKKIPEVMEKQRKQFVSGAMRVSRDSVLEATKKNTGIGTDICLKDTLPKLLDSYLSEDGYFEDGNAVADFFESIGVLNEQETNQLKSDFAEQKPESEEVSKQAKDKGNKDKKAKPTKFDHAQFYSKYAKTLKDRLSTKLSDEGFNDNETQLLTNRIVNASANVARYNQIFNLMAEFAAYGFNKSHSEAYALISLKTAYLKAHYPATYMASVASHDKDLESVAKTILESKRMGLTVLPPDVNKSMMEFDNPGHGEGKQEAYRLGLSKIRGVNDPVKYIFNEREENGEYATVLDFYTRIADKKIKSTNKITGKVSSKKVLTPTTMKTLVSAGLFDSMVGDEDKLTSRELIRKTLPLFPLLLEKSVKDNPSLFKLVKNSIAVLTHPIEKVTPASLQKAQENFRNLKDKKYSKKIEDGMKLMSELFGSEKTLTVNMLKSIRADVDIDREQESKTEYELTGTYISSHYLEASGAKEFLKGHGYQVSIKNLNDQMHAYHQKDHTESESGWGDYNSASNEKRVQGREYLESKVMGTIVEKKVFYGMSPRHKELRHSVSLTIDDGSSTLCQVYFDAEDIFDYGKIDAGLNKLTEGEAYGFSGGLCSSLYDSAPMRMYAKGISSRVQLPIKSKDKKRKNNSFQSGNRGKATVGQVNYIKSLLKQRRTPIGSFLEEQGLDTMSDIEFDIAKEWIADTLKGNSSSSTRSGL